MASAVGRGSYVSSTENCVKYAEAGGEPERGGGGSVAERLFTVCRTNADELDDAVVKDGPGITDKSLAGERLRSKPISSAPSWS